MPGIERSGRLLDQTSDAIDEVNVLKLELASKPMPTPITTSDAESSVDSSADPEPLSPSSDPTWKSTAQFQSSKPKSLYRQYDLACTRVQNFYIEQHTKQTVAYNLQARHDFKTKKRARMGVWKAIEMLGTLVDESDPDTSLGQIEHLLQTAEAIRRDGKPEWMQVAGLVHDLGKLLHFFGSQGQWDVVGDTFIVGCAFSPLIIYPSTFSLNPDISHPIYSTPLGIYTPHCGLDNVMISWGHDEYLYNVLKGQSKLPEEALWMIRYHSFYSWHREGAYEELMEEKDYRAREAVRAFNPYDLYSKSEVGCDVEGLRPYYEELIGKYFPEEIDW